MGTPSVFYEYINTKKTKPLKLSAEMGGWVAEKSYLKQLGCKNSAWIQLGRVLIYRLIDR